VHGPDDAKVVDHAPDSGVWTYRLVFKPVIASAAARFAPTQPTAGRAFTANARVTLDSGATVVATDVRCSSRLGTKALAGGGPGRCRFAMPKTAKGKKFVVTLKVGYEDAAPVTVVKTFRVR